MNNEEIRALTQEELLEKLQGEKENYQRLRFAHAISPIENPMKLRSSRRLIARIQTEVSRRKLAENPKKPKRKRLRNAKK